PRLALVDLDLVQVHEIKDRQDQNGGDRRGRKEMERRQHHDERAAGSKSSLEWSVAVARKVRKQGGDDRRIDDALRRHGCECVSAPPSSSCQRSSAMTAEV